MTDRQDGDKRGGVGVGLGGGRGGRVGGGGLKNLNYNQPKFQPINPFIPPLVHQIKGVN